MITTFVLTFKNHHFVVYGFSFLNKIHSVFKVGFKFLYLRLYVIFNKFLHSAGVTINRTSYRSLWIVNFMYFRKKVKLRCLYLLFKRKFAVFEVNRFSFFKVFFPILFFQYAILLGPSIVVHSN